MAPVRFSVRISKDLGLAPIEVAKANEAVRQEMTPERALQMESVLRILADSIQKLKVSMMLPRIFENPLTVRTVLRGTEFEHCCDLLETYLKEKKTNTNLDPHLSHSLIKVIDIFHENHKLIDLLPEWEDDIDAYDKRLLEAFSLLFNITEERLKKSATVELIKEKKIHQIYHENELMKKNIREFQTKLRNQKINLRWKLAAKDGVIQKYEEDLAYKKWDNNVHIQQETAASSRRIRNIQAASTLKQKELEEELEKTKATYEKVLKTNLQQEKDARDEKNKLLLQLQALIQKYDTNIGDKIKENISLQEAFEIQKIEFDKFMVEYQREEEIYENIVRQREEEEKRRHNEALVLFMMNRAARIIQKYWKRYRRQKKKQAKKAKAGKAKRR